MKFLLSLFGGGVYGYLIASALSAALSIGGTYYVVHNANAVEIADLKLAAANQQVANVTASLDQLKKFIADMHTSVVGYDTLKDAMDKKLADIQKAFQDAIKAKPLPIGCKPDDVRMRNLAAAVAAVNAATP